MPPRQCGDQQAAIEGPRGLEAPFETTLEKSERIADLRLRRPMAVGRLMGELESRHRVDQGGREHIGADQRKDEFRTTVFT